MTSREREEMAYVLSALFVGTLLLCGFFAMGYWLGGQP